MPFDFDAAVRAPFRMRPGLRRVAAGAPGLTPTTPDAAHLRAKLAVLGHVPADALWAVDGFDPAPVLDLLCREAGGALRREAGDRLVAPRLGWSVDADTVAGDGPVEIGDGLRALPGAVRAMGLAALSIAEDLAVVDAASGTVPWLAVCLPSRWSPAEKIGRSFAEIHGPVADGQAIVGASRALVALVTSGERWERFVWTLTPLPTLDAHPRRHPGAEWPEGDALAAAAFFRTEHQQFLPLAGTRTQALFSIGVEVEPLAAALDSPGRARRLHDALAGMSDAVLAYRGLAPARDRLLAWLAARPR